MIDPKSLKINPDNPRTISKAKFNDLCNSLLEFPQMMPLSPIVVQDGVILRGNQRKEAIVHLLTITDAGFTRLVQGLRKIKQGTDVDKFEREVNARASAIELWETIRKDGGIPDSWVVDARYLTPEQRREFMVKDNAHFGEWDYEALGNWGDDLPKDWGVPVWDTVETEQQNEEPQPAHDKKCPHCGETL